MNPDNRASKWRDALWIGAAQGLALLPGFSRSGATISTARLLGWPWKEAARFSFLLSIPTILGGSVIETLAHLAIYQMHHGMAAQSGFAALVVAWGRVRLLFWILDRGTTAALRLVLLGGGSDCHLRIAMKKKKSAQIHTDAKGLFLIAVGFLAAWFATELQYPSHEQQLAGVFWATREPSARNMSLASVLI